MRARHFGAAHDFHRFVMMLADPSYHPDPTHCAVCAQTFPRCECGIKPWRNESVKYAERRPLRDVAAMMFVGDWGDVQLTLTARMRDSTIAIMRAMAYAADCELVRRYML